MTQFDWAEVDIRPCIFVPHVYQHQNGRLISRLHQCCEKPGCQCWSQHLDQLSFSDYSGSVSLLCHWCHFTACQLPLPNSTHRYLSTELNSIKYNNALSRPLRFSKERPLVFTEPVKDKIYTESTSNTSHILTGLTCTFLWHSYWTDLALSLA